MAHDDEESVDVETPEDALAEADDEGGLFGHIAGHDDVKVVLRSALRDGDTHVLMVGPPGSGKSAFLQALEDNLPGVRYVDGEGLKKSRLKDLLKENPPILLIDEMDEMDAKAYRALAVPMEHGRVVKEASREQYDVDIDTQIIGSCNDIDRIPGHVLSRMRDKHFEEYTTDEYVEVCVHMLPREVEWVETDEQSRHIAEVALDVENTTDPRIARDIAQMASGPEEVETVAAALFGDGENVDAGDISVKVTREDVTRTRDDVVRGKMVDALACEVVTPSEDCVDLPDDAGGKAERVAEDPAETAVANEVEAGVEDAVEKEMAAAIAEEHQHTSGGKP